MQDEARISKMRHNSAKLGKIYRKMRQENARRGKKLQDEARHCKMRQEKAR